GGRAHPAAASVRGRTRAERRTERRSGPAPGGRRQAPRAARAPSARRRRRASGWRISSLWNSECFLCRRRRHLLEHLAHDVVAADLLHPELGLEHQPVPEPWYGHGLDVVRGREVATVERGAATRELQQRERSTRAGADLKPRAGPGGPDEVDDVATEAVGHVD